MCVVYHAHYAFLDDFLLSAQKHTLLKPTVPQQQQMRSLLAMGQWSVKKVCPSDRSAVHPDKLILTVTSPPGEELVNNSSPSPAEQHAMENRFNIRL